MNPKTIVKTILTILGLYIFVYFPVDKLLINPEKKTVSYVVLEKRTGPYTESTGKYSSRTTDATFIRIREENGSEETLTITDPFISEQYIIGNTYVKEKRIEDISFLAFIVFLLDLAFTFSFIFLLIVVTIIWLNSERSWVDVWNRPSF